MNHLCDACSQLHAFKLKLGKYNEHSNFLRHGKTRSHTESIIIEENRQLKQLVSSLFEKVEASTRARNQQELMAEKMKRLMATAQELKGEVASLMATRNRNINIHLHLTGDENDPSESQKAPLEDQETPPGVTGPLNCLPNDG
jgi:hypothetical protein